MSEKMLAAAFQGFEPVDRRQTLTDQIAEVLRERVVSGNLAPGDRLPSEQQLAEAFEVSRTVIREAVARLKVEGLITTRQGLGAFVSSGRFSPRLDATELDASMRVAYVFELRCVMEPGMVGLAARRRTARQLEKIKAAQAAFALSVKTQQDDVEADIAFHRSIAEASGNPLFVSIIDFTQAALRESLLVSHTSMAKVKGSLSRVQREHEAIYRAICDRDEAAARRAAANHLTHATSRLSIIFG